jgi:uncharacterized protein
MYDAYGRGDFDTAVSCFDPAVEFALPAGQPGGGTYHGRDGVIEAVRTWAGAWDDYRIDVRRLTELGDHVLARTFHQGRGRTSGVDASMTVFHLLTVRDEKIVQMRMYYDEAEARAAATAAG